MEEKFKVGGADAGDPYGLKFFAAVSEIKDERDRLKAELATLRAEVDELKRIIVGQCGVITELRIKLAGDAIKSFAGEALK